MRASLPLALAFPLVAFPLMGCAPSAESADAGADASIDAGHDAGPPDAGPSCEPTIDFPDVVTFETDDGVTLAADLYVPEARSGAAIALFHMIPPANRRTNYPPELLEALVGAGFVVVNVDRRGAGDSGGIAEEAYLGPNGKLDVAAAVDFLLAHPCAPAPSRIGIVGASNGTTSVLDYAVFAASDPASVSPGAMVFLTGGTYTENQNAIADERAALDPLPLLFVYSTAERDWSEAFRAGAPSPWQFAEHADGDHGTRMLTAAPESVTDVVAFLRGALDP